MDKTGMLMIGVSRFIYGEGAVTSLPAEIKRYAGTAFLVGGRTTLPLVRDRVLKSMNASSGL